MSPDMYEKQLKQRDESKMPEAFSNHRHESKADLAQVVAEAEQRYIETEKAARGS